MTDKAILAELENFYAASVGLPERSLLDHFSNKVSLLGYIDKARQMQKYLPPGSKILDWGAGFGQMTLILRRLGYDVVPYDVVARQHNLFSAAGTQLSVGQGTRIPFPDASFDAVLSCGVLEHVEDFAGSVAEVHRVLKPRGYFFVFHLPYVGSPSEFYADLRGISVHPTKFTQRRLRKLLADQNFKILSCEFENGIPKRLSGPLRSLRGLYDRRAAAMVKLDRTIVRLPVAKYFLSGCVKAAAQK